MPGPELPPPETVTIELDVERGELEQLRARLEADGLAPAGEETLLRYLAYLGAGYLEAQALMERAGGVADAYTGLHHQYGAVSGESAVLRFHYFEDARIHAAEQRAAAAHDRSAGAYAALIDRMRTEIATREMRIRHLEAARRP